MDYAWNLSLHFPAPAPAFVLLLLIVASAGCVAFPTTARFGGARAVSGNPIAARGEETMNGNDFVSHVASGTPVTKATADRLVGSVFSAIGDALAGDDAVAIAGSGRFSARTRAPRRSRNRRTGEIVHVPRLDDAGVQPIEEAARSRRPTRMRNRTAVFAAVDQREEPAGRPPNCRRRSPRLCQTEFSARRWTSASRRAFSTSPGVVESMRCAWTRSPGSARSRRRIADLARAISSASVRD